jgi:hypothetical protein
MTMAKSAEGGAAGRGLVFKATEPVVELLDAPIARVWAILADFGGVGRYMKGVEVGSVVGTGVGAVRTIPLPNGTVRERQESLDPERFAYSYRVLDPSPLAMSDYLAEVRLEPAGAGACKIEWRGGFAMPSDADAGRQ